VAQMRRMANLGGDSMMKCGGDGFGRVGACGGREFTRCTKPTGERKTGGDI
jgi:hypothetical protein